MSAQKPTDPIDARVAELLAEAPQLTDTQRQDAVRLLAAPKRSKAQPERAA